MSPTEKWDGPKNENSSMESFVVTAEGNLASRTKRNTGIFFVEHSLHLSWIRLDF